MVSSHFYRPLTKFAKVLFSQEGGLHPGRSLYQGGGLHPGGAQTPPPPSNTTGYGQRAGSTHPTGMHSCLLNVFLTSRL